MLRRGLAVLLACFSLSRPLLAAPLFPDVPEQHWAGDAVATLVSRGLLEGYPDGSFKGDRAMSRWEVATLVARALARLEAEHATFASRADLDALRPLIEGLRDELEALGVRVDNLEDSLSLLDRRVAELERITFYGYSDTRVVFQSFQNQGVGDNDAGRRGAGVPSGVPYLNYTDVVGTRAPSTWRPSVQGVLPVVDYRVGRALSSGTGFTSLAVLGMNIKVSPDIDAGAEFAAYSSQGDAEVDAYWGVSAPYLSNPFTANAGSAQSLDNTPYTRMTLDKFWVTHKPSGTKLIVGTIDKTRMAPLVYAGQSNLGVYGPKRWPGYGFDLSGSSKVGQDQSVNWEVLGTRFGDGVRFQGTNYQNYVLAANLGYAFSHGETQLNFARMSEEAPSGGSPLVVGLTNGQNVAYGASSGWFVRQWVNPPGFFAMQRSAFERSQTGVLPNTADTRPISGWNANADNAIGFGPGAGNYGPQSQDNYGLTARWDAVDSSDLRLGLAGEAALSDYRANKNSPYSAQGAAWRVDVGADLKKSGLALGMDYVSVDPDYGPAAWFGDVTGSRVVKSFAYTGTGFLHDNTKYPHNRQGFRARANWSFDQKAGALWANLSLLDQKRTSLYDVRVTPGALGLATPTGPVLGFSPGFVDPIFYGYATPYQYGSRSGNSFDANLNPLEDRRGHENAYDVGASYKWPDLGLQLSANASRLELRRGSSLSPGLGGSQNLVDIDVTGWGFEAVYELSKTWKINTGLDYVSTTGHYDPAGLYNAYAVSSGSTNFANLDSDQFIPHLGVDVALSDKAQFNVLARHYATEDHVAPEITPGQPQLGEVGSTQHAFNWDGWQLSSEFKVVF